MHARPCAYCGCEIPSDNSRRVYCSIECRRAYQNTHRKVERGEIRERHNRPGGWWWGDPWQRDDPVIWDNALPDPVPR